jgi:hypothetical protein
MLVALVPPDEDHGHGARALQLLMRRLLRMLSLPGRNAVALSRAEGRLEIICAFELSDDAERAARAVDAAVAVPRAGWASLHTFILDEPATARLLRIAGPGEQRPMRAKE